MNEPALGSDQYQQAVLNILEDFGDEKLHLERMQSAVLNILEDSDGEKSTLQEMQRAVVNILEDLAAERETTLRLNSELEARVRSRTSQLESANQELESFAYSVSHDLRAPLRHIDGFIEMLSKRNGDRLDEKSRHYLDTITDAARKMGSLIDNLLMFSRMGRAEVRKQPVALAPLVREVIRDLAEPEGRIDWVLAPLPEVMADPGLLRTVFANLLGNAAKFTRNVARAVVQVRAEPGIGGETVVAIKDNGAGFDMEFAGKLFGVFQRLHSEDEFEGTGIGLANVRRIIARHGGRAWAEGAVGVGATFYFSLPGSGIAEAS